jgi:DNA-binding transcriptional LysR family regulator
MVQMAGASSSVAVADNALDVAVVTLPVRSRQLAVNPFSTDRLVAIVPPGPRRRRRRALTPADLAGEPLILHERGGTIRRVIEAWFRRGRVTPRVGMELGNGEAIKELVSAGLGPSITSEISVPPRRSPSGSRHGRGPLQPSRSGHPS